MGARKTSKGMQVFRTVVAVLAAAFAVLSAGCAAERATTGTVNNLPPMEKSGP